MEFKSIDQLDIKGKKVFIRVDFNVPMDAQNQITDDNRIQAALPTIQYALGQKAKVILASHLGRPKGKPEPQYSLAPVARRLGELLKKDVKLAPDCIGPEVEKMVSAMNAGDVILLENLRFHKEEEKNDPGFARNLAKLADIYINDAFAVSHRAHASVEGITKSFKEPAAGFLMKEELRYLNKVMMNPARPLVAVVGGAKVSGKLEVLQNLLNRVDKVIIGGGMAFTFLRAKGLNVGKSLVENELLGTAREILEGAEKKGVKIYLPVDCVVADKMEPTAQTRITSVQEIPPESMGLDIGPATVKLFGEALQGAKTVLWN
ncbi:MAG: phosphoglycerate kinase, partial [Deltaproteobacteria bacterium]|nr:phosphoglycerate kinase [Deltaproteobacteria bacterium]